MQIYQKFILYLILSVNQFTISLNEILKIDKNVIDKYKKNQRQ